MTSMAVSLIALSFVFPLMLVDGLAVMSVDLGSEWIKIGVVSPGVPMEIALNKESKRKTPNVISFKDGTRYFGEDAQVMGLRSPQTTYSYYIDLLAKNLSHPIVQLHKKRFPYYNLVEDEERASVVFKGDENINHSPDELIAQVLSKSKELAEQSTRQVIKECVITVPGYFNQLERNLVIQAAEMANLKVLQLMNSHLAVALNYGIYRGKDFTDNAQYVLFYDMGASSTTATLVSYQTVKSKHHGASEVNPQITILGVGFDRTLGGLEIQIRLRDYLARKFNEMNLTKNDVFNSPKSMAKLFKEAGRVKNVLSANADHYAQIESLLDDKDFRIKVTRNDLENLLPDFFERVAKPIEVALNMSHLTKDVLSQVVLFGAGTRVPKVQQILEKTLGYTLAKNLNTDEAAAMGAVYKAADSSIGFQVKKIIIKDAVIYPIQIVFERESEEGIKRVRRILFGLMNPYPQKKIITFNKHTSDFSFNITYGDLGHLPVGDIMNIGLLNLSQIKLHGISDIMNKYSGDNIELKGIKVHFEHDESGLLKMINSELIVEKSVSASEEGTFSKLGSTISKLFGTDESGETLKTDGEKGERVGAGSEDLKNDAENASEQKPNAENTENNTHGTSDAEENVHQEIKVVVIKEPIKSTEHVYGIGGLTKKQLGRSIEKLSQFDKIDKELNRRANALNNLESFVIETESKLLENDFIDASTPEERETILAACRKTSDWLYDEGSHAETTLYEDELKKLKTLAQDLFSRVWEHRERPEALNALKGMLNHSSHFMLSAKNLTKTANPENYIFEDSEVDGLEKIIKETEEWRTKLMMEQEKLKGHEKVKLTVKMVRDKLSLLDREVKYLINKMKLWQPKNKVKKETSKEAKENINEDSEPPTTENVTPEPDQKDTSNNEADQHVEL